MKTGKTLRRIVSVVFAAIVCAVSISAYALVTGTISSTDHEITLNSLANYNKIQCERMLKVTSSYVKGSNKLTWYTYTGTATQLAYCNAITGTATVSVIGIASDNETMQPKSTTISILGQDLSAGITCTATRTHNLDLVFAEGEYHVTVKTPDGVKITDYIKSLSMSGN